MFGNIWIQSEENCSFSSTNIFGFDISVFSSPLYVLLSWFTSPSPSPLGGSTYMNQGLVKVSFWREGRQILGFCNAPRGNFVCTNTIPVKLSWIELFNKMSLQVWCWCTDMERTDADCAADLHMLFFIMDMLRVAQGMSFLQWCYNVCVTQRSEGEFDIKYHLI